jgi:hypothetical protein
MQAIGDGNAEAGAMKMRKRGTGTTSVAGVAAIEMT